MTLSIENEKAFFSGEAGAQRFVPGNNSVRWMIGWLLTVKTLI